MTVRIVAVEEFRRTVRSRRFALYLLLVAFPIAGGGWFAREFHDDPEAVEAFTDPWLPEPLTEMTPEIAMMTYFDFLTFAIILVAVLSAARFVAGERSANTLQLLVTRPIAPWTIVIGKYAAFVLVFVPLILASVVVMGVVLEPIGIGAPGADVFLGYVVAALAYGLVYASIATLFSVLARGTTAAALASFIFVVFWIMVDFLTVYMPEDVAETVEHVALSHHVNDVLGYLTDGEAAIFAAGAVPADPSTQSAAYSTAFVVALVVVPLVGSAWLVDRIELS